ncbi:hypothetical protein Pmani_009194 [Petrolisthes manimaculis]|uniref:Uncharacterized protein n=1 Tax=Petrolisthes manimaculis TaxID=1843537 RepID=A0AAE1Q5C8_9EUCA|nr:hypothetical protein Pmani_009194 [Petrolisthes manimaculis]
MRPCQTPFPYTYTLSATLPDTFPQHPHPPYEAVRHLSPTPTPTLRCCQTPSPYTHTHPVTVPDTSLPHPHPYLHPATPGAGRPHPPGTNKIMQMRVTLWVWEGGPGCGKVSLGVGVWEGEVWEAFQELPRVGNFDFANA